MSKWSALILAILAGLMAPLTLIAFFPVFGVLWVAVFFVAFVLFPPGSVDVGFPIAYYGMTSLMVFTYFYADLRDRCKK